MAFLVQGGAPPDSSVTTAKIVDDAVTLAKLAAGTDGELITWDTSGNPAAVAVGTATHVLTSNGAGAAPTFQAAGGGGWEFVSAATASSSATIAFTSLGTGYDYQITFAATQPATDAQVLKAQLGVAGPTYRTSGYFSRTAHILDTPTDSVAAATANIAFDGNTGNATDENSGGVLEIIDPAAATDTYYTCHISGRNSNGQDYAASGGGHHGTAEAMVAVKFYYGSGNISTGEFTLYRRANA
jgi:hypothetical protein